MKSVKNVFLVMSVFLALALISSCMKPIVITDSGKTYNLPEDSPFQLQLPGNPTTGYVWQLMPYDETVVQQVGEPDYQVNDDKIGRVGCTPTILKRLEVELLCFSCNTNANGIPFRLLHVVLK